MIFLYIYFFSISQLFDILFFFEIEIQTEKFKQPSGYSFLFIILSNTSPGIA